MKHPVLDSTLRFAFGTLALTVTLFGALSGTARADALDKSRIPADVRWFAHVDVEALKRSDLFAALQANEKVTLTDELDELEELGLKPLEDVRSIAVYCQEKDPERCVLLLVGNEHIDTALARLQKEPSYRAEELDGRPLHVWGDEGERSYVCVARRDGSDERLVVRASDKDSLRRALAVIDRKAESLASVAEPSVKASPAPGSILFAAAATELSELGQIDMASNVSRMAKDIVLDLGESKGEIFALLDIQAKSENEARQLQQVMQGALALVSLAQGDNAELAQPLQDLVAAFQFTSRGKNVHCEFRMSVRLLLQDLRRLEDADEQDEDDDGDDGGGKK